MDSAKIINTKKQNLLRLNIPSDEAIPASIDKHKSVDIADNDDKSEGYLSDLDIPYVLPMRQFHLIDNCSWERGLRS